MDPFLLCTKFWNRELLECPKFPMISWNWSAWNHNFSHQATSKGKKMPEVTPCVDVLSFHRSVPSAPTHSQQAHSFELIPRQKSRNSLRGLYNSRFSLGNFVLALSASFLLLDASSCSHGLFVVGYFPVSLIKLQLFDSLRCLCGQAFSNSSVQ